MINSVLLVLALGLPAAEDPQAGSTVRLVNFHSVLATDGIDPIETDTISGKWTTGGLVVRGQDTVTTPPLTVPLDGTTTFYQPGITTDPFAGQPYPAPITQDPWLGGGIPPYAAPTGGYPGLGWGVNGPQPHRFGWQAKYDVEFMPGSGTSNPAMNDLEILGVNIEKIYTTPWFNNWVFSMAPQFNYRSYDGPQANGNGRDLPANAYRLGLGLELQTPVVYGWSWEFGFTPALATDFKESIDADAVLFDGKIVAYWTWDPTLTWVIGAEYWDRVDSLIIPHAGLVYTPGQFWEFQLVVPNPRVNLFLGAPAGIPTWLYARGEYHVEAYHVESRIQAGGVRTQITDWRVLGGLKWESGWFSAFAEAGYMFNRDVKFDYGREFDIDGGFISRVGLSY